MRSKFMKHLKSLCFLLCIGGLVACGGSNKSKKGLTPVAAGAEAPPSGGAKKLDREVSVKASKAFDGVVKSYGVESKKGWTPASCSSMANRFKELVKSYPKLIEARFNAGVSYQNCNMNKEAEGEYKKALKLNPGHAPSLSNMGEIYFKGGNEAVAKQYWEKAVASDVQIVAARNNLASLMIRDIRKSGSITPEKERAVKGHLSRALAVDNDNVEAYVLYSLLYMEGSKKNKSRLTLSGLLLEKASKLDGNYPPLHNALGLLDLKKDNVPKGLASFRRAVSLDPNFVEARMNVGNIVLDFRKYGEAKLEFEAVLKKQPNNYDAHIGLGVAKRGLKDLNGAEASYNAAKKIDSSRAEAYFNLGVLYQDFRASVEDQKIAKKAYLTAKGHFKSAASKGNSSVQKESQENIKGCDKNIKSIEEFEKFQQQADYDAPENKPQPVAENAPVEDIDQAQKNDVGSSQAEGEPKAELSEEPPTDINTL